MEEKIVRGITDAIRASTRNEQSNAAPQYKTLPTADQIRAMRKQPSADQVNGWMRQIEDQISRGILDQAGKMNEGEQFIYTGPENLDIPNGAWIRNHDLICKSLKDHGFFVHVEKIYPAAVTTIFPKVINIHLYIYLDEPVE